MSRWLAAFREDPMPDSFDSVDTRAAAELPGDTVSTGSNVSALPEMLPPASAEQRADEAAARTAMAADAARHAAAATRNGGGRA
jgi:hypothetical protein